MWLLPQIGMGALQLTKPGLKITPYIIPSEGSAFQMVEQAPYQPTTQTAACAPPLEEAKQALDLRVHEIEQEPETFV